MADTCPTCGKFTDKGRTQLAENAKLHPIYGTDFTKPLSEIIGGIRNTLAAARGQLDDVGAAFTGWKEHLRSVEGLLTCGIVSLAYVMKEIKEHEARYPHDDGPSLPETPE